MGGHYVLGSQALCLGKPRSIMDMRVNAPPNVRRGASRKNWAQPPAPDPYRSVMVSQLSETSSSDRRLVDPASCRLGARTIPSVQRCSAGLLPHYDPPLCGEFARGHAAAGLSLMGLVNEGSSCGRPAHDHWMISPSSGQHKRHYSPIMIAPFIGSLHRDGVPEKLFWIPGEGPMRQQDYH
jgi:hypothetical protein